MASVWLARLLPLALLWAGPFGCKSESNQAKPSGAALSTATGTKASTGADGRKRGEGGATAKGGADGSAGDSNANGAANSTASYGSGGSVGRVGGDDFNAGSSGANSVITGGSNGGGDGDADGIADADGDAPAGADKPAATLVVDWGEPVELTWNVPSAKSAELVWVHLKVSSNKRYAVKDSDLPAGAMTIDTHELLAGPYIVSLLTMTKSGYVEHPVYVHVRPVVTLTSKDTSIKPRVAVDYPIHVDVPAGADKLKVFINDVVEPVIDLTDVDPGRFLSSFKPIGKGDNKLRATIKRYGLNGRPSTMTVTVDEGAPQDPCPQDPAGGDDKGADDKGGAVGDDDKGGTGYARGATASGKDPCQNPGQADGKPEPGDDDEEDDPPSPTEDPGPDGGVPVAAHLINAFPGNCRKLEMHGDGSSTDKPTGAHCKDAGDFLARLDWYSARDFGLPRATVAGNLVVNAKGPPLPRDTTGDQTPDFPVLDFESLKPKVSGTLRSAAVPVSSWHPDLAPAENLVGKALRNVVVVGTKLEPIHVNGDVLIGGDLVIKGYVRGAGTLYVTGNVFIPADIFALSSAFPYSAARAAASQEGAARVASATDALGIVAQGYIFAGDNYPLYSDPTLNPHVQAMYGWFAEGKKGYKKLHEPVYNCQTNVMPVYEKSMHDACECKIQGGFSLIEASLYAKSGIHGSSGAWLNATTYVPNSFAINGTVVTNAFDIVTTPDLCATPAAAHPVHKYPQGASYLNLDWRLLHGVKVFSQLKPLYKHGGATP